MKQTLRAFLFLLLFIATGNTAMADEKQMSRNKELYVDASSTPLNKLSRVHPSTSRNYTLA